MAFTGQNEKTHQIADYVLSIPSTDTSRMQGAYMVAAHIICDLLLETGSLQGKDSSQQESNVRKHHMSAIVGISNET
ncbi:MAG: hypothetical protein SVY53_02505 [Chloroflexota bacterium]|nr:hypothetical protein [Chloroflexota bacterium]